MDILRGDQVCAVTDDGQNLFPIPAAALTKLPAALRPVILHGIRLNAIIANDNRYQ